jgi:hypothetical protein
MEIGIDSFAAILPDPISGTRLSATERIDPAARSWSVIRRQWRPSTASQALLR